MKNSQHVEQIILDAGLMTHGRFVSFEYMQMVFNKSQSFLGAEAPQVILRHMAQELGLKPAFTTDGFSIVPLKGPDIECPPSDFTFEGSNWPKPSKAVGEVFYPLIKKGDLSHYFAHSVRWFKHPLRPGTMLPVRLETFFLGIDHPVSRIYIDVPVVFKGRNYLSYMRVSLTVFEIILGSQVGQYGKWCQLSKEGSVEVETRAVDKGVPTVEEHTSMWDLFSVHEEMFDRNKKYVESNTPGKFAARVVADHLVKLN